MKQVTVDQILEEAKRMAESGNKWHFHILTPECKLNDSGKYALILEDITDSEIYVCNSNEPYMDIGKELVKLLHGNDVVKEENQAEFPKSVSPQAINIIKRMEELNKKGIKWHHHMLFPGCKFNKYPEKFVVVFEDKETGELLESVTDYEPKDDLKQIETLFYGQKEIQ